MVAPFQSRDLVNGSLLRQKNGANVSILVKIVNIEGAGRVIKGKTTDNMDIRVMLTEAFQNQSTSNQWVEVIGTVTGNDVIKGKEVIEFQKNDNEQEFHAESYNMIVQFFAHCDQFYKID